MCFVNLIKHHKKRPNQSRRKTIVEEPVVYLANHGHYDLRYGLTISPRQSQLS